MSGFARRSTLRALLAIAACAFCLASLPRGGAEAGEFDFPQTEAGRCAAAYFDAFNATDETPLRGFVTKFRSPAALAASPLDERVARFEKLRGIFGALTPVRVTLGLDRQITLFVHPAKIDGALVMRLQLEDAPSHYLSGVTISGIGDPEAADDLVNYVATRAAPVDAELRSNTVRSVADTLRNKYVYPDLGARMADALLRHEADGDYADLAKAGALADTLTEDLVGVSHDQHIWVEAQNPFAQASTDPENRDIETMRRANFDLREARVLPGNIGYLKFDMVHDEDEAQKGMADALATLAGSDALVIDLRDNIGGGWGTGRLILGYVLPGGTVLSRVVDRSGKVVEKRAVPRTIPGEPFGDDVPVYVLTSEETGSAAEALAYALQQTGRATIVGEVTKGMAHPSEEIVVNDSFRMSVPYLRSENMKTGTDWEGTGVVPQLRVSAADALDAAVNDAKVRIAKRPRSRSGRLR